MKELNYRIITSIILIIILYTALINKIILAFVLFLIVYISFIEFYGILNKLFKNNNFLKFLSLSTTLIYLTFFSLSVLLFLIYDDEVNKFIIIYILSICISTDIGGYTFGKLIKGKKLTSISPNKTYSGMIGSFAVSILITYLFFNSLNLNINNFVFTIIVSFLSQIGDLFISYLKRLTKLKDTGTILPGHGGLLDRIDGIILSLPISLIILSF